MAGEGSLILVATRSNGKLRELREIFADFDLETIDLDAAGIPVTSAEDAVESYPTFLENSLAKARYFHELTGMSTLADDSGLVVDALDGAPGVLSRRYSGRSDLTGIALDQANNEKLMRELARAGASAQRSARYVCVASFVGSEGELTREGKIEGRVIDTPRGSGGFGYDAHVEVPELNGTMAEAGWREKAEVSHRARAFRALLPALRELGWV